MQWRQENERSIVPPERPIQVPPLSEEIMSKKVALAAALFAALVIAVPSLPVAAQTSAQTKEEKKAAKAETKAKKKSERAGAKLRQKQCGEEWKDARKAGKVEKYMTWPKYYSECTKRLKEKAA
jgi:curli biogenesis system outer membrane secretion channel CsgG